MLLFFFSIGITSCFDCRDDDCMTNEEFRFKVEDQNGKLIFGALTGFKQYIINNDSIQIYGFNEEKELSEIVLYRYKEFLVFYLERQFSEYLITYSFANTDSLDFDLSVEATGCCGPVVSEYFVEINASGHLLHSKQDSIPVFVKP